LAFGGGATSLNYNVFKFLLNFKLVQDFLLAKGFNEVFQAIK